MTVTVSVMTDELKVKREITQNFLQKSSYINSLISEQFFIVSVLAFIFVEILL
jgi:hypothetical protein